MNSACKPLRSADQMTGLAMNELEAAAEARIKELEAVLREYIDAADQCLSGADDIANMLRFGAADKAANTITQAEVGPAMPDAAPLSSAERGLLNAERNATVKVLQDRIEELENALEFCGRCAAADLDPDPYRNGAERLTAIEERAREALTTKESAAQQAGSARPPLVRSGSRSSPAAAAPQNPDHWSRWETRGDGYGETSMGLPLRKGE